MQPSVSVTIVTWNSEAFIARCLSCVFRQTHSPLEVVLVDNASADGTLARLPRDGRLKIVRNTRNAGFAAAQNQAIRQSRGDWILTLNPDAFLDPCFIEAAVEPGRLDPRIGAVCGKLRSIRPDFSLCAPPVLDSTGIYFTPAQRHFDRGWREPDDGRYNQPEYVFGACAAAALFRRAMIEDTSDADGFFDPDFFAYREDADVAWRAQLLGWRCLYTPAAAGCHVRRVTPENRAAAGAVINMHSVKNRFLMRIKNMTGPLYWRLLAPLTARDLVVLGACLLEEHSSLPAFWHLARAFPRAWRKRRRIMERRRVSDEYLASWFGEQPHSEPVREPARVGPSAAAPAV